MTKSLWFSVCMILSCSSALAQFKADLPLPEGTKIVVDTYDSETRTFAVFSSQFPCEGYSYVMTEALAGSIAAAGANEIRRDPKSLAGKQFDTTAELKTVADSKIKANHDGQSSPALKKLCSAR